jgi:hypothetical protein
MTYSLPLTGTYGPDAQPAAPSTTWQGERVSVEPSSEIELLVDDDGERYFVAELPAFRVFGQRYDEVRAAAAKLREQEFERACHEEAEEAGRRAREAFEEAKSSWLGYLIVTTLQLIGRFLVKPVLDMLLRAIQATSPETPPRKSQPPPGQPRVGIGKRELTDNQRALFEWLRTNQDRVAQEVRAGIYEYYKELYPDYRLDYEDDQGPWVALEVPEVVEGNEIDDNLLLKEIGLDPKKSRISFWFESTWELEHGFGVRMDNFKVAAVGTAHDLLCD